MTKYIPCFAVNMYRKARKGNLKNTYETIQRGVVLNGCCLIYLKPYLEHESLLFELDTFLYGEELLLSIKCKTKGYKILYDPTLRIEHRASISTKVDKQIQEYVRMRSEKLFHAYNIVKKCLEDNPWEKQQKSIIMRRRK